MTDKNNDSCNHFAINSVMCKFCGMLQCDFCRKHHESQHIANGDKEIPIDEFAD